MTTSHPLRLPSPGAQAALASAARRRATQLRDEAQREFFDAAARALRRAWIALRHGAFRIRR